MCAKFPLENGKKNITWHNKIKTKPGNNTCCTQQRVARTLGGSLKRGDPTTANRFAIYLTLHMFSCLKRHVPKFSNYWWCISDEIRVGFLKNSLSFLVIREVWVWFNVSLGWIILKCIEDNQDNSYEDIMSLLNTLKSLCRFLFFSLLVTTVTWWRKKNMLDIMRERWTQSRKLKTFLRKKYERRARKRRTAIGVSRLWDESVKGGSSKCFFFFLSLSSLYMYSYTSRIRPLSISFLAFSYI